MRTTKGCGGFAAAGRGGRGHGRRRGGAGRRGHCWAGVPRCDRCGLHRHCNLQPGGGPAGSAPPSAGTSSAVSRTRGAGQQARARAKASRRAARLVESGRRAQASWEAHGRPTSMVVVRPTSVDLVTEGRLTRRVPRRVGDVDAARAGPVRAAVLAVDNRRQRAARRRTRPHPGRHRGCRRCGRDDFDAGRWDDAAGGGVSYTGGGRLVLHGVTVSSSDRAFHGVLPPAAGRPFIVVSSGGRLEAIDATISDLGTPDTDRENRAGVQFTSRQQRLTGPHLAAAQQHRAAARGRAGRAP